ncbi:glycosyltransferase [Acinetobacter soli]|uniref:glycosyltransferase n=1 Tax=Acinetobacter soli TaxID=487316 RepID=UPI003AA9BEEF
MKKNVIFVAMHYPSENIPEAGQKISYQNLKKYVEEGCNVHLITFVNKNEKKYTYENEFFYCASIEIIDINNFMRFFNFIRNFSLPLKIGIRNSSVFKHKLNRLLDIYPDAYIHIEYEEGANFLFGINNEAKVVFHDIISQSIKRFLDKEKNFFRKQWLLFQYFITMRWEKKIIKEKFEKIVLNDKDKDLLVDMGCCESEITVLYPVVSNKFSLVDTSNRSKKNILFWGAMNRFENQDAILWFIEEIFPLVIKKNPYIVLYIVGANPSDNILKLSSKNIIVTGFVDNPIVFFEKCSVAIVPLRYGAGIKIKVLEALAAKLQVVSTSVGAEGIRNKEGLLYTEDTIEGFANKVIELTLE